MMSSHDLCMPSQHWTLLLWIHLITWLVILVTDAPAKSAPTVCSRRMVQGSWVLTSLYHTFMLHTHNGDAWTQANSLSSFKVWQVSHFSVLSFDLLLHTLCNAFTLALYSVNKTQSNDRNSQPMFLMWSQHKQFYSYSYCLVLPLFSLHA